MNLTDEQVLELTALCNALADGVATDAQKRRLAQLLSGSEEARRFYVRAMALSASLHEYADEMQTDEATVVAAEPRIGRPPAWVWTLGSLAAAAVVVLTLWLAVFSKHDAGGENSLVETEKDEFVARLTSAKDCEWSGQTKPRDGDHLRRGQQLKLAKGVAEITFDSGAQVLLEGPASLDLHSAWEAALRRGTLKATVPAEAIGFRISNASVEVVDLGTEFSMVADETGATEVFVLKGAVETSSRGASATNRSTLVLRETESRRFARSGVTEVRDSAQKIKKLARLAKLERPTLPLNFVHWNFDEAADRIAAAQLGTTPNKSFNIRLEGFPENDLPAMRTAGRWDRALHFDGRLVAQANFPGLSKHTARTVAFWVKVPADAPLSEAGAMVAWPLAGANARALRVTWNRNPAQGSLGALRTELDRGYVIGSTPLRDGKWHHVAVVLVPPLKNTAVPFQVKQYVDGRLDVVSAKHLAKRRAKNTDDLREAADDVLWLGRSLLTARQSAEHFRGDLDELFIADRALAPTEIQRLIKENQLGGATAVASDTAPVELEFALTEFTKP